jgi:hypothetical protein
MAKEEATGGKCRGCGVYVEVFRNKLKACPECATKFFAELDALIAKGERILLGKEN